MRAYDLFGEELPGLLEELDLELVRRSDVRSLSVIAN